MLAYVFWHWPRPDVPRDEYERRQRAFHASLARSGAAGFLRSTSAGVTGAPWANGGRDAYEDWYLVEGSAALDPLNDAAVSAARERPHADAAAVAAGGTAGLYRLRLGDALARPTHATWFEKPADRSHARLLEELRPIVERGGMALWCRQMVLGPSPELCLHGETPVELPDGYQALRLPLAHVWDGREG